MAVAFQTNAFQLDGFQTDAEISVDQVVALPTQSATATVVIVASAAGTIARPFMTAAMDGAVGIEVDAEIALTQAATGTVLVKARSTSRTFQRSAFQYNAFDVPDGAAVIPVPSQVATLAPLTIAESSTTIAVPAQVAAAAVIVDAEADTEIPLPSQTFETLVGTQLASVATVPVPGQTATATVEVAGAAAATIEASQTVTATVEVSAQANAVIPAPSQLAVATGNTKPRFVARRMPAMLMRAQKTAVRMTARRKPVIQPARRAA